MNILMTIVIAVLIHISINCLILYRHKQVLRLCKGVHPKVATLILGPEIGWKLKGKSTVMATVLAATGSLFSCSFAPDLLFFPVMNLIRDYIGKTQFGVNWGVAQVVTGFQENKTGVKSWILGHIIAPGIYLPKRMGVEIRDKAGKVYNMDFIAFIKELFVPVKESLTDIYMGRTGKYVYKETPVIVLPILNAALNPGRIMLDDLEQITGPLLTKEIRGTIKNLMVVDPLIWYAYKKGQRWAIAIMDHEIGHRDSIADTKIGKATFYLRIIASPKTRLFWGAVLTQEALASISALLQDPQVDKVKASVLATAFFTYVMKAKKHLN